jgi:uncharacterized protein (UPF0248 family)
MPTEHIISSLIEKEYLASLYFPASEVLTTPEEIQQRKVEIEKGLFVGNGYKSKVIIYFRDSEGNKYVETTIWAVRDKRVVLKNNMSIPIHRIIKVMIQSESLKYPTI